MFDINCMDHWIKNNMQYLNVFNTHAQLWRKTIGPSVSNLLSYVGLIMRYFGFSTTKNAFIFNIFE